MSSLSDEELFNKLVAVKGLGPWSVQMYMMFQLHRANVLAPGDLGIRRGLCLFHGQSVTHFESAKQQLEIPKVCASWQPYSTLGCWYMWRLSEQYMDRNKKNSTTSSSGGEGDVSAGEEKLQEKKKVSRSYTKAEAKKEEVKVEPEIESSDTGVKRNTRKRKAAV